MMEVTASCILLSFAALVAAIALCKLMESLLRAPLISGMTEKYVLVTGCDTGFGNLVTRQLDERGIHVFAACLTAKGEKDVESQTSERVTTLHLDVTSHESIVAAFELIKSKLPKDKGLWGLVNNAGIGYVRGPLEWCIRKDYERTLQVNLLGVIDVTITFLPLLKKAKGRVVNIASALSRVAMGAGGYAESKYGIQAFSDTLRRESQAMKYGIRVSILEPGYFRTPLTDFDKFRSEMEESWDRLSAEKKAQYNNVFPEQVISNKFDFVNFVSSDDLTIVTRAMIHGLLARWPNTRYTCGFDMRVLFIPISYAPTWFQDWFFVSAMGRIIRLFK